MKDENKGPIREKNTICARTVCKKEKGLKAF